MSVVVSVWKPQGTKVGQASRNVQDGGKKTSTSVGGRTSDGWLLGQFLHHQDQAAFETLVQRHGPMVQGVCRGVLQDAHDADDAFQSTFLVLVRKAASIAQPNLLGNWLYGVAYRVAARARANAARRSAYETRAAPVPLVDPPQVIEQRELRSLLHAQMRQLPEKYRAPLVLCYLEGKTNKEAARLLGWPTGSISARLSQARELLRARLSGLANATEG